MVIWNSHFSTGMEERFVLEVMLDPGADAMKFGVEPSYLYK